MWHEILFRVLSIINYVVLGLIALPILCQVLNVLLAFVPKKTWKKSEKKGRIAYLIPAHNEEDVIYNTVRSIVEGQNYPRELYDIYVVADNCTDRTAQFAKEAGAIVLEHNDPDPAHHMALYPLKYGIDYLIHLTENPYDIIVHLDADNLINDEFSDRMNDAYQAGVDFARPYEGATNGTQNFFTKANAMLYSFDSRYGSRVRERLGLAAHVNGSGAMMSVRMLQKCGGYDCDTISDDAEFNLKRMFDGYKGHFIEDAIVYEDMPSSYKDTKARNQRMGNGVMGIFKQNAFKMLGKFFTTGNFSFIELFLFYFLNMLNVLIAVWVPLYYIYHFTYSAFVVYGGLTVSMMPVSYYYSMIWRTLFVAACILVALFVLFGFVQGLFLVLSDYKKLGAQKRRQLMSAVFLFPAFLILYASTFLTGAVKKPKGWVKLKRNTPNERGGGKP